MIYTVSLSGEVDFAPATEEAEILQNVRTLLLTRLGSVPLDRGLGLSWEHLDMPLPAVRSLMTAAIIDLIDEYEPRARVQSVEFEENIENAMEGILRPRVIISIGEEDI